MHVQHFQFGTYLFRPTHYMWYYVFKVSNQSWFSLILTHQLCLTAIVLADVDISTILILDNLTALTHMQILYTDASLMIHLCFQAHYKQ